jgi:cytochrome c peroxidase
VNLQPTATTGRDADLDAIAAYIAVGIRAPISSHRSANVTEGRALFGAANCQSCHGGANWTRSRVDFTPPPLTPPETITAGQLVRFLGPVGTFDPIAFNEVRAVGTSIVSANGSLGFNVPSLLSVFAGGPYLHSGTARTLGEVLDNVVHRSAGTGGVDTISNPADREAIVRFLDSIDASTPPFP